MIETKQTKEPSLELALQKHFGYQTFRPGQLAAVSERHRELGRLRLVVTRAAEQDAMTLVAECPQTGADLQTSLTNALGYQRTGSYLTYEPCSK